MADYILQTTNLCKDFRGFVAVDRVCLNIRRGHIHALIGPNGAGKTTVFNLLTKFLNASSGAILFDGEDITPDRPAQTARRGMVRSFQISAIFPQMTVMENVRVALQRRTGLSFRFWRAPDSLLPLREKAANLLEAVGLASLMNETAGALPYGRKRALELATTLALEPALLLLDEPTQGMGIEDIGRTTEIIRRVAQGKTVLMVEHNMGVVGSLADRITVMQRGSVLAEGTYQEMSVDPRVVAAYLGSAAGAVHG